MSNNYVSAFDASSEEAAKALDDILKKIIAYGSKERSFQLLFAYNVLKQMCQAITVKGTHYAIYCDIFVNVLMPNVDPASSPKHWNHYLEMVRYFFYLLSDRKLYPEMNKVYNSLISKPHKLQTASDYEFLFGTYTQQLLAQRNMDSGKDVGNTVSVIYTHMADLFTVMLQKNHELNFVYKDLMKTITRFLIPKRSPSIYKFIAAGSNHLCMFDALFKLLADMREPQIGVDETKTLFMDYIDVLMQFIYIDTAALWSGEQISLRFLKVCRELSVFKTDKAMSYTLSLMYYFVKLVSAQKEIEDFVLSYAELSEKFKKFFERFGETLKQETWFMEFVVVMSLLISEMDLSNLIAFSAACKKQAQIGSIELNNAHLLLILELVKLAPSITQTKLISWTCCTSTRKHTISLLSRAVLKYYTSFVSATEHLELSKANESSFQKIFITIMRHSVQVFESMTCINSSSADLQSFHASLNILLSKITTSSQVNLCVALTETLVPLQNKFTAQMWVQLLLRLRRATYVSKDTKLIAEIHAIQIGFMLRMHNSDYGTLLHQVGIFYTAEHILVWDMCLLEILETSKSPLKPILEIQEKKRLHSIESQIVFKYQKSNLLLQDSLLKFSQTNLDFILVARQCNQLDTHAKVKQIFKALQLKSQELIGLKRVEKLTMAHTSTLLVGEQVEKMKKTFDYPLKDFVEDTLDSFLLSDTKKRINVDSEMNVINMALEALYLFEEFYNLADSEPISADEVLLDWEAILADVSYLARLLQLRGYLEHACQAWLLLYRIANTLEDSHNTLRSLAFLCEHAAYLENNPRINLAEEVSRNTPVILNTLRVIQTLVPRRQNYLLLCLCQLAYYYARSDNFTYSNLLLKLVELKRDELPERHKKFDFVLGSLQAVKFRILWKFKDHTKASSTESICILRQIETTFNRFRGFVQITSEDSWNYMILLFGLMQEFAECTINRLCDNIVKSFYVSILKVALETGAALRVVQSLTSWALANLQAEGVDKAQIKLRIIECFLGTQNVHELSKAKSPIRAVKEPYKVANLEDGLHGPLLSVQMNPGMETMRRVVQVNLSPLMKDKLRLASAADNRDLQRFFEHGTCNVLSKNSLLQWTYLSIGYINARLFFLIEEFSPLEEFYEKSLKWCENQTNAFLLLSFQNFQLMGMEHYINYLRAHSKFEKAIECVESALRFSYKATRNVDKVYSINLELQQQATKSQMLQMSKQNHRDSLNRLRRALEFRLSPEEEKRPTREKIRPVGRSAKVGQKTDHNIKASAKKTEIKEVAKRESAHKTVPECIVLDTESESEETENTTVLMRTKFYIDNAASNNTPGKKASCTQRSTKKAKTASSRPTHDGNEKQSKSSSEESVEQLQQHRPTRNRREITSKTGGRDMKKLKATTCRNNNESNKENIAIEMIPQPAEDKDNAVSNFAQSYQSHEMKSKRRERKNILPVTTEESCLISDDIVDQMQSLQLNEKLSLNDAMIITDDSLDFHERKSTRRAAAPAAFAANKCSSSSGGDSEKVVATIITKTRGRPKKTERENLIVSAKDQTVLQPRTRRRKT